MSRCSIGHAESRSIGTGTPLIPKTQFSLLKLCDNVRVLVTTTLAARVEVRLEGVTVHDS